MIRIFLRGGRLTKFGVLFLVGTGFLLSYLSVNPIPWRIGKVLGLSLGLAVAAIGGFSGRAAALSLPPPFTNYPLGWRYAKRSYSAGTGAEGGANPREPGR